MQAIGNAIHLSIRTSIQSALAVGRIEKSTVALKDPIFSEFVPIFSMFWTRNDRCKISVADRFFAVRYILIIVGDAMNTCCSASPWM